MEKKVEYVLSDNEAFPVCPYCCMELEKIEVRVFGIGQLRKAKIFTCPHCNKVLGTGAE
jgi:hypothetical protein